MFNLLVLEKLNRKSLGGLAEFILMFNLNVPKINNSFIKLTILGNFQILSNVSFLTNLRHIF